MEENQNEVIENSSVEIPTFESSPKSKTPRQEETQSVEQDKSLDKKNIRNLFYNIKDF